MTEPETGAVSVFAAYETPDMVQRWLKSKLEKKPRPKGKRVAFLEALVEAQAKKIKALEAELAEVKS